MDHADKHQIKRPLMPALLGKRRKAMQISGVLVLLIWAILYIPNIGQTPRWYGDETITLGCGQELAHGLFANRAVWNTYINPQFCYQPGYVLIVGALSNWGGGNIAWPRMFNSFLALGIALLSLFWLGRRVGLVAGCWAALIFLTYEQSVIHFRWVYAHNAAALGIYLCACSLSLRRCALREWQSGFGLAIAALSHPLALHGGISAWLNRWSRPRSWYRLFLPPLILGLLCILPVWFWNFSWWWNDLHNLREFYAGFSQELGAGLQWPINFWVFMTHDWFHLLSACSMVFCLWTPLRPLAVTALVLVALLTQNRQNLPVFYYQAVVALPLFAACFGYSLEKLRRRFLRTKPFARWVFLLLPFFMLLHVGPKVWKSALISRNDPWVISSNQDHLHVIDWLNQHTQPADLVVCHWNIGWRLHCQTADPMMCVAWEGLATFTYEHGLPKERFRYSADIRKAKFFVLTDIDRIWTLTQPNVNAVVNERNLSGWQPVYQSGTCLILAPPNYESDAKR